MPILQIQYVDGETETRPLTKKEPLSIGKHPSNDIIIEGDDVAMLHCRISWNKKDFEVVAAGPNGLDIDGVQVRHSELRAGSILRVGDADISIVEKDATRRVDTSRGDSSDGPPPTLDENDEKNASLDDSAGKYGEPDVGMKPISEEQVPAYMQRPRETIEKQKREQDSRQREDRNASNRKRDSEREREKPTLPPRDSELVEQGRQARGEDSVEFLEVTESDQFATADGADEMSDRISDKEVSSKPEQPAWKSKRDRFARRPGEQDLLKSPFVLVTGGIALVLLLAAGTYSFLILRSLAQNRFDAAQEQRQKGNYSRAVILFQEFLTQYPRHSLTNQARIGLAETKIEAEISGSAGNWGEGYQLLVEFVEDQRNRDDFATLAPQFANYSGKIALGAAKDARRSNSWSLLGISDQAKSLLLRHIDEGVRKKELTRQIENEHRTSENAILKHEAIVQGLNKIDANINAKDSLAGLENRRQLLLQYPELVKDARLAKRLDTLLEIEQSKVRLETIERQGQTSEVKNVLRGVRSATIATRYVNRTGVQSNGKIVYAVNDGLLVATDVMTGKPMWEQAVGTPQPFFPVQTKGATVGVLVYDANSKELVLRSEANGALLWRQTLESTPISTPVIDQGQVFISTSAGTLEKIDLGTGELISRLEFSQPLATSPTILPGGDHLVVPGASDVLYSVQLRPFECVSATYTGHAEDTIIHPLMRAGANLIACVNDRVDRCQLLVLRSESTSNRWKSIQRMNVDGMALDPPLLRGNRLFVPTRPERVTVFTVTDEPLEKSLKKLTTYQVEKAIDVPTFIAAGPDDQIWISSSALRNYQLTAETLRVNPKAVTPGLTMQPLQFRGTHLIVGRGWPSSQATIVTQMLRDDLVGQWRLNIGAEVKLLANATGKEQLIVINDLGEVIRINEQQFKRSSFVETPLLQLDLPQNSQTRFDVSQLAGGNLVAMLAGKEPRLWVLNKSGQVLKQLRLSAQLEVPPIELKGRLLLATGGRLSLRKKSSSDQVYQDFLQPIRDEAASPWVWLDSLTATQFAAVTESGKLSVFELREGAKPHIAEVTSVELPASSSVVRLADESLVVVDRTSTLKRLSFNLQQQAELNLPAVPTGGIWSIADWIFVPTQDQQLQLVKSGETLELKSTIALGNSLLSGPPVLKDGNIVLALNNGVVQHISSATGKVVLERNLSEKLVTGPTLVGERVTVAAKSGRVLVLDTESGDLK